MNFLLRGDSRFFWNENIGDFATLPSAWDSILNTGLGHSQIGSLWITSYLNLTSHASNLGLKWEWIQLLFWALPAILISFVSSYLLFNYLFNNRNYAFLSGLIYLSNTYFLMVLTGGQLGVSLSYSLAPLVFLLFIKLLDTPVARNFTLAGLALGIQLLFDPRIVFITLSAIFIYFLFNFPKIIKIIRNHFFISMVPFVLAILLNSFWILPLIFTKSSPLPQGLGSAEGFKFFSFADFSHTFSFLHPNWPENIFGKVYFLKPEFLILPLLAFSSLFFRKSKNVLFFSFLAIAGAFLAKGMNSPFGEVNKWLFQNFPGMVMFRDPTKWYLLIALSYSILIPYALSSINLKQLGKRSHLLVPILFIIFWFFTLREFPVRVLDTKEVPKDYVILKDLLTADKEFARTLWVPGWQRYGFFSTSHPAIGRKEVLNGNLDEQLVQLRENNTQQTLKDLSVKYIIIPCDSQGEFFLTDRKFDKKIYEGAVAELSRLGWLDRKDGFEKMAVFEIPDPKDHFWSPTENMIINSRFIRPTEYEVQIQNAKMGDRLIFSERYSPGWIATNSNNVKVYSKRHENNLNSFALSGSGKYRIYYEPQKWVNLGLSVSTITTLAALAALLFGSKLKK